MNERIDKLLVKAGAYFGGEGVDYSNFDPKKFAELIVKECIKSIRPYDASGHFEETIREHFYGVEE